MVKIKIVYTHSNNAVLSFTDCKYTCHYRCHLDINLDCPKAPVKEKSIEDLTKETLDLLVSELVSSIEA